MSILKRFFDHEYKELERFKKLANAIVDLEPIMEKLSDDELKAKTPEFKEKIEKGATLDDILVEAYATAREVAYRVLGEKAFYTQLLGAIAIHYGNIAELKTGEGKTLATVFPAYLNALGGKGVHVITVNEYLTTRNAEWMGGIYNFLGVTVGVNVRTMSKLEKKDAYNCDILYTTNNEVGFDYLRDNMVVKAEERVQRGLNYAIIDEVDSALIDEARTPLIISGGFMHSANLYRQADMFAKSLKENEGYIYDEKTKAVSLDETGIAKAEKSFGVDNLYDINNTTLVHFITQALKANYSMHCDIDYVVSDGKVIIVDPFTGRLMPGRNYSEGLHQAIEAKENVQIQEETKTLASITFQNLFRMYNKLSGMTGTAKTEEEEFRDIYNMYVITIPTNKPVARIDYGDLLYATKAGKYKAIVREIKERHAKGQPILVGTIAVETSELISSMLKKEGIYHEVLNAKNHAREAEIIAKAGQKGSVTIATNMAGRGTDIKIDEEVKSLGGLFVIGTERHESRRIDNQLRGRSGRQGDPGGSQFCISFEDDLMVRFGADRTKTMLQKIGFNDDQAIRNKMFSNTIESAQKRVEGNNFDIRKHLLEYDNVINQQRLEIYEKRNRILDEDSIHELVLDSFKNHILDVVEDHVIENSKLSEKDINEILEHFNQNVLRDKITYEEVSKLDQVALEDLVYGRVVREFEEKLKTLPEEIGKDFEKAIFLRVIDTHWMEHINSMSIMMEGIQLRGYGQENPLREYTKEGGDLFTEMLRVIDKEVTMYLLRAEIRQNTERKQVAEGTAENRETKEAKKTPKKVEKVGRNDPCPCGSGRKYKQCCGK